MCTHAHYMCIYVADTWPICVPTLLFISKMTDVVNILKVIHFTALSIDTTVLLYIRYNKRLCMDYDGF